ncbi:MAG: arsenate reductase ArsC [Candidatus Helarchaeota archaeon]
MNKKKILFLCSQNSCRSQMAEGLLRHFAGNHFEVFSAGIEPAPEIHPLAVEVMREIGIDISQQQPNFYNRFTFPLTFAESRGKRGRWVTGRGIAPPGGLLHD